MKIILLDVASGLFNCDLLKTFNYAYLCHMIKMNRYISIFLLVCFLPVLTPKEFIHNLFGHEDTNDIYHSSITIEKQHRHCGILQITFSSFISYLKNVIHEKEFCYSVYNFHSKLFIPGISVNLCHLRAPPSRVL